MPKLPVSTTFLPHRIAAHFEAMCIVNQSAEDAVGARDREIAEQSRRSHVERQVTVVRDAF